MKKLSSGGQIQNRKKLNQQVVYRKLSYRIDEEGASTTIQSPTDVDLEFEFRNQIYIRVEYKKEGNEMPDGQNLTFTRVVDGLHAGTYQNCAYLLLAEHNIPDETDICAANDAYVTKIYYKGNWKPLESPISVGKMFELLFEKHNIPLTQVLKYEKKYNAKLLSILNSI
jgi:hypothetical protein